MIPLEILWYFVIGIAVTFYVVLDGFDLGVGMLHLFVKKDEHRRLFLNAIGPVWDGNELWLVVVGGALLAGFPNAYASLFSGFYNFCMAGLAAIIFRTVAIEFRSKRPSLVWRKTWDILFSVASYLIAFGLGVVLGNLIQGLPLDSNGDFTGSFASFLGVYPLLIGVLSVCLFILHGSLFLMMKVEDDLYFRVRKLAYRISAIFITIFFIATIATILYVPYMLDRMLNYPYLFLFPLLTILSIFNVPRLIHKKSDGKAFIFSCLSIVLLFSLYGIGLYPNLIRSSIDPENASITLFNAASSSLTLGILLIIVAIGVPLILGYGYFVYRTFRGKVKLDPSSY